MRPQPPTISVSRADAQLAEYTDLVTGYGPTARLFTLGALSGLLIGASPGLFLLINHAYRYWATRHRPFQQFQNPGLASILNVVPDVLMIGLLGGILALCRMITVQRKWFWTVDTNRGPIRLGLDDLIGLSGGILLLLFILNRHGFAQLMLFTGVFLPFLGLAFTWLWDHFYCKLARRWVTIPLDVRVTITAKRTLEGSPELSELFRVQSASLDSSERRLTIQGAASQAFYDGKNEQRLRDTLRNIPIVTQNVTEIRIVDTERSQ